MNELPNYVEIERAARRAQRIYLSSLVVDTVCAAAAAAAAAARVAWASGRSAVFRRFARA